MDDIFAIKIKDPETDAMIENYTKSFEEGGCYPKPLKLTNDDNSHFLECEVLTNNNNDMLQINFKHWNKNRGLDKQLFYKGKSWHSSDSLHTKRGALIGTYIRMDRNTSDLELYKQAKTEKRLELLTLGYPINFIKKVESMTNFTPKSAKDKVSICQEMKLQP